MSVTLLYYIDNGPFTKFLNDMSNVTTIDLQKQNMEFKQYCAELEEMDIDQLVAEADYVYDLAKRLNSTDDLNEINQILSVAIQDLGIPSVYGDRTLDECMEDPNWVLNF